jgi:hypothetical protein
MSVDSIATIKRLRRERHRPLSGDKPLVPAFSDEALALRFAEQHAHYSEATDVAAAYLDVLTATDDHTLTHAARGRDGFAAGAVLAAEWVAGRRGAHGFHPHLRATPGGLRQERYWLFKFRDPAVLYGHT